MAIGVYKADYKCVTGTNYSVESLFQNTSLPPVPPQASDANVIWLDGMDKIDGQDPTIQQFMGSYLVISTEDLATLRLHVTQ